MPVTLTEIEAILRLRDDLSPQLQTAQAALGQTGKTFEAAEKATSSYGVATGVVSSAIGNFVANALTNLVSEVGQAAKSALEFGGTITDLSAKMGTSTTATQAMKIAAEQAGGSIEQVSASVAMMNKRLGGDDASAIAAVGRLGLSFEDLKRMKPEEAFYTLTDALSQVEDQQTKTALGSDIFGRSFADLIPIMDGVEGGFSGVAARAEELGLVVREDAIKALDSLGDTLDMVAATAFAKAINEASPFIELLDNLAQRSLATGSAQEKASQSTDTLSSRVQAATPGVNAFVGIWNLLTGAVKLANAAMDDSAGPIGNVDKALKAMAPAVNAVNLEVMSSDDAFELLTTQVKDDYAKAVDEGIKKSQELREALNALTGQDVIDKAQELAQQVTAIGGAAELTTKSAVTVGEAMREAIAVVEDKGDVAPDVFYRTAFEADVAAGKVRDLTHVFVALGPAIETSAVVTAALGDAFNLASSEWANGSANIIASMSQLVDASAIVGQDVSGTLERAAQEAAAKSRAVWQDFGAGLGGTILSAITGGGDIGEAVGGFVGKRIGEELNKSFQGMFDKGGALASLANTGLGDVLGGAANAVIPGVGALLGAGLGKIFDSIFKTAEKQTNDLRDQFVASAGGIDKLNESAVAAGVTLDAVLSAKKPEALKAAIADLQAAIEAHKEELAAWGQELNDVLTEGTLLTQELLDKTVELFEQDRSGTMETLFAFLNQSLEDVSSGFNDAVEAWAEPFAALVEGAEDSGDALAEMQDWVRENQDDFQRFGSIAVGVYEQLQVAGMDSIDALEAMRPALEDLADVQEQAGFATTEAFNQMLEYARLADEFEPLIRQVEGLGDVMVGLNNTGLLTSSLYADLAGQVTDTFNEMVQGGADGNAAMRMIQPTLQQLWQLQQDFGWEVDASTQALLDQAEASGIVGDQFRDAGDRMVRAVEMLISRLNDLITTLGGSVPQAAAQAGGAIESGIGTAAERAAQRASAALGGIDWGGAGDAATEFGSTVADAGAVAAYGESPTGIIQISLAVEQAISDMHRMGEISAGVTHDMAMQFASAAATESAVNADRIQAVKDWARAQSDTVRNLLDTIIVPAHQTLVNAFTLTPEDMSFESTFDYISKVQVDRFLQGLDSSFEATFIAILDQQRTMTVVSQEMIDDWSDAAGDAIDALGDRVKTLGSTHSVVFDLIDSGFEGMVASFGAADQGIYDLTNTVQGLITQIEAAGGSAEELGEQFHAAMVERLQVATEAAIGGFNTVGEGIQDILDLLEEQNDAVEKVAKAYSKQPDAAAAAIDAVKAQYHDYTAFLSANFDAIGAMAASAFATAQAAGGTFLESLLAIQPTLQTLSTAQEAFGLSASKGLQHLLDLSSTADTFRPLLTIVGGIDTALSGLSSMGALTADNFRDMGAVVSGAFHEMASAGVSTETAIALLNPTLQKLWQLQKDLGLALDPTTQALIDQAVATGAIGPSFQDAGDRMADAIDHMVSSIDGMVNAINAIIGQLSTASNIAAATVTDVDDIIQKSRELVTPGTGGGGTGGATGASLTIRAESGDIVGDYAEAAKLANEQGQSVFELFLNGTRYGFLGLGGVSAAFSASTAMLGEIAAMTPEAAKAGGFFGLYAKGGIATQPTAGIFGEAGPEALIPLDELYQYLGAGGRPVVIENHVYLDGREVTRMVQDHWSEELDLRGVGRRY